MANVPFPITGESIEDIKRQVYELIRKVYEEKIGGADLGDVFSLPGDVLTLVLDTSTPGLYKTDNKLAVQNKSDGGIYTVGEDGLSIKLADGTLTLTAAGLKVTPVTSFESGIATLVINQYSVTVSATSVQANSKIFITAKDQINTVGSSELWISSTNPGVSFDITSNQAAEQNTPISWMVIN